jgi:WD40 repeat protein/transcriptional regulator with XRE-family HTH domain
MLKIRICLTNKFLLSILQKKKLVVHQKICYHRCRKSEKLQGILTISHNAEQIMTCQGVAGRHTYQDVSRGSSPSHRGCAASALSFSTPSHLEVIQKGMRPMKRTIYGERDYPFGQAMHTLRASIGLTQAGLADLLGVSRRAVGEWEAGSSYPKAEHLKQLITLGVQHHAFPSGREAEEIRGLWRMARQKMVLDEQWLTTLLGQQHPLQPLAQSHLVQKAYHGASASVQPASKQRVDWGDALAVPTFYGREQELVQLTQWVLQEHCRVVSLLGIGGIGKSALAVHLMYRLAQHFDVVIFRSLRDAPSCEELLDNCLRVLAPQALSVVPSNLQQRIDLLLEHLRISRTLLVLDNLESLLQEGDVQGRMRSDFAGYGRLLRQLAQTSHQSCLLLTSREKPAELRFLGGKSAPVRSLLLGGLDSNACERLFADNEVAGTAQDLAHLVEVYAGNPLALKIVVETINDLFGGEIAQFFSTGAVAFGSIADLLHEQFARLSPLEQSVLYWLAIVREPITLDKLQTVLMVPLSRPQVLEAIDSLRRRSLIELGQRQGSFTLQSVVLEYLTTVLIAEATHEIQQRRLSRLIQHGLELASTREYIRQTQERLLVVPLLTALQGAYRGKAEVEKLLLSLLDEMREWADFAQGYGPANLIALLRLHRGHLRGLNLSRLMIRDAYLQSTEMQDTSLAWSTLRESVLTETLDATWAVDVSRTGTFWAAGSWRGDVRVWCEDGQRLHRIWQAHSEVTFTLAFSPDERLLATGSFDGTVKLWEVQSGTLLWMGRHTDLVHHVAFAPDGHILASGGSDAIIQLWNVSSGKLVQTLANQGGAVYALAWSPDGQLLASGCEDGSISLWQVQADLVTSSRTLVGRHSHWVHSLAFAPDGSQLVSGSWDNTVNLWDVASGRVCQVLTGHTQRVHAVAWSPDGGIVASASSDKTIWLWDVAQQRYIAALHGHSASICHLAFTPDSSHLLSGSEDSTIRVWDVNNGRCIRILQGYAVCMYDLDWSPDSMHLVSGSTDGLVIVWNVAGKTLPRILRAHQWIVFGVAWSPDGRLLASSGWDTTIRVWEAATGNCLQVLQDPDRGNVLFNGVAWSPDGRWLACGSYQHGVSLWDMTAHRHQWFMQTKQVALRRVAWSPNGHLLASGSEDGSVCLWDAAAGTLRLQLTGQQVIVASVAWSPDGTRLVSAGAGRSNGELVVWEVQSGKPLRAFAEDAERVSAVIWDRSGNFLISGGSDGKLCWWEVQNGKRVRVQEAHQGAIRSLKCSPDGRQLASCGDDGAIRIWDVQSAKLLSTLRHDRPYERLNITGVQGLTEAQKTTLRALGAVEDTPVNGNAPV